MKTLYIIVNTVLVAIYSSSAFCTDLEIDWEVANPFKFISDKRFYTTARSIYDELGDEERKNNLSVILEKKLQDSTFNGKRYVKSGWTASIAVTGYAGTCWNFNSARYKRTGTCRDYIHPVSHDVKIWLTGSSLENNSKCTWTYSNAKRNKRCNKPLIIKKVPYPSGLLVKVLVHNTDGPIEVSKHISVDDVLVVGMGDSYGSGEGNPDIPVTFYEGNADRDILFTKNRYTPRKDKGKHASWLDRRCHRSLYSYQFKTALAMALDNPKRAVTFLSYACTGAIIPNIVDSWEKASENKKMIWKYREPQIDPEGKKLIHDRKYWIKPQIASLIDDITCPEDWKGQCSKGMRVIDYLLLSIGGNDIGFRKYVINIAVKNNNPLKLGRKIPGHTTRQDIRNLIDSYTDLNDIFTAQLPIKNCSKNGKCNRVLLSTYPNILNDENGNLCSGDKGAFYIPFRSDETRGKRIQDTYEKVIVPLRDAQNSLHKHGVHWSIVNRHSNHYATHGFCARNPNNSRIVNENFIIPHKKRIGEKWRPFKPTDYRAYGDMQRWVRLPVDSTLAINLTSAHGNDWFFSDETCGMVHPTAIGHAATADATIAAIRKLE